MKRAMYAIFLLLGLQTRAFCSELLFDLTEIKNHIEERFAQARVEINPMPHLVIEDILPSELYQKLQDHWPDNTFAQIPLGGWRKSLPVGNINKWQELDEETHELWRQFATYIVDEIVKKKVAQFFYPFLSHRFSGTINLPIACHAKDVSEHRVCEDYGIGIGPHIDQAYIFSSVIFYFPDPSDVSSENLGTCLYSHIQGGESIDFICEHPSKMKLEKILPYKPNTLCALLQTPRAWHSAAIHSPFEGYKRKVYQTLIFVDLNFLNTCYGITYIESTGPALRSWLEGQPSY